MLVASIHSFGLEISKNRGHNVLHDPHHYEELGEQEVSGNLQELRVFGS